MLNLISPSNVEVSARTEESDISSHHGARSICSGTAVTRTQDRALGERRDHNE
jgi:hypothetical protein